MVNSMPVHSYYQSYNIYIIVLVPLTRIFDPQL